MAKNIIFIESPDRAGKDTLINKAIYKVKNVKTYHCIGPATELCDAESTKVLFQLYSFYDQLRNAISDPCDIYIFNRSFLGEYVWSQFFNRNKFYDKSFVINTIFNSKLFQENKDKFKCIFLYVDPKILEKRINESSEDKHLYQTCNLKDVVFNIDFVSKQFVELEKITRQHMKTICLKSNDISDIKYNVKLLKDLL